jgi:hypothetical protein
MRTYRIFDCTTFDPADDILIFGPRWLIVLIVWLRGPYFDYQTEAAYQAHYERARR